MSFVGRHYTELVRSLGLRDGRPKVEFFTGQGYGEAPLAGFSFVTNAIGLVTTVHLHREGHEGYRQYPGRLPGNLRFDMSRGAVVAALGKPDRQGEAGLISGYWPANAWDRFDRERLCLHVEYGPGEKHIVMISVMLTSVAPGKP